MNLPVKMNFNVHTGSMEENPVLEDVTPSLRWNVGTSAKCLPTRSSPKSAEQPGTRRRAWAAVIKLCDIRGELPLGLRGRARGDAGVLRFPEGAPVSRVTLA